MRLPTFRKVQLISTYRWEQALLGPWRPNIKASITYEKLRIVWSQPDEARFAGKAKLKRAPPRPDLLSASMWPSCASMMDRQIDRPMPMPVSFVVKKLSKRRGRCDGSIPGPLSSIMQHTVSGSDSTVRMKMQQRPAAD